ncbi:hypothetical protein K438DRAFT_1986581 [Mycena galopus ATCC 62051]|nr:hypothetical protein K438DRAFT_1986581 [Mycena galopus ATCC 62051]
MSVAGRRDVFVCSEVNEYGCQIEMRVRCVEYVGVERRAARRRAVEASRGVPAHPRRQPESDDARITSPVALYAALHGSAGAGASAVGGGDSPGELVLERADLRSHCASTECACADAASAHSCSSASSSSSSLTSDSECAGSSAAVCVAGTPAASDESDTSSGASTTRRGVSVGGRRGEGYRLLLFLLPCFEDDADDEDGGIRGDAAARIYGDEEDDGIRGDPSSDLTGLFVPTSELDRDRAMPLRPRSSSSKLSVDCILSRLALLSSTFSPSITLNALRSASLSSRASLNSSFSSRRALRVFASSCASGFNFSVSAHSFAAFPSASAPSRPSYSPPRTTPGSDSRSRPPARFCPARLVRRPALALGVRSCLLQRKR